MGNKKNKPKSKSVSLCEQFPLKEVIARTENQQKVFDQWDLDKHLVLHGTAGTGKTFLALYLALENFLDGFVSRIYIVRSIVPSRNIGFLPGDEKTKAEVYEAPYRALFSELFGRDDAYEIFKQKKYVEFITTSFIRGITLNNCIVIVDEVQNCSDMELHSVITRVGQNCTIIFSGDTCQDDLTDSHRQFSGLAKFMKILARLKQFALIEFGHQDIQRSDLVKQYIIEREKF